MYASKILVPVDFSPAGKEALDLATVVARDTGAKLLIVHVEELTATPADQFYPTPLVVDRAELLKKLQGVVPTDSRVQYEHKLLVGNPAAAIVEESGRQKVDFIVMPTHGRRGLSRLLMGSVAEAVLRQAPCPVLVVRQTVRVPAAAAH